MKGAKRFLPVLLLAAACTDPRPLQTHPYSCGGEVRAPADLEAWRIVEENDDRVALIRELDTPVRNGATLQTHRYLLIERQGRENASNLRMSGLCDLRQVVPGHSDAHLAFASASGTSLKSWVTERERASGRPATGRIKLAVLEENDQEVPVVVAVRPLPGSVTCQGNPRTPLTVELSRPLGDRTVVDIGVYPPRRL